MIETINKLPLVIISSPRTGSTALAIMLQKKLNAVFFNEPGQDVKKLNDFLRYASLKKNFILKEHAEVILNKYNSFNFNECCTIRISRQNFIEQLVSSYITGKRKKWFYSENENHYKNEVIDLDEHYLKEHIVFLQRQNTLAENFKHKIDFDIVYEDILEELILGTKTIQPKNYNELLIWAKEVYDQT